MARTRIAAAGGITTGAGGWMYCGAADNGWVLLSWEAEAVERTTMEYQNNSQISS